MPRISKENYYLDIAETNARPACGGSTVPSSSKTTRSFPPATTARPAGGKTASISASAHARSCRSRAASATSSAAASTLRRTPSSRRPGATWSAAPSILWAATRARASCCTTRQAVPCAAVRSSTQGSKRSSSAARRQSLRSCPCGSGSTRTILFPKHKKRRSLFKRPSFFCSAFSGSISRCRRSGT